MNKLGFSDHTLWANARSSRRLLLSIAALFSFIIFALKIASRAEMNLSILSSTKVVNLNKLNSTWNGVYNEEHVLILTPLKNAETYLPRYFEQIERLSYPKHLISLAFLVSDTTDNTIDALKMHTNRLHGRYNGLYNVRIFKKDFNFELPEDQRHAFELQPIRRSHMARARNFLLSAALTDEYSWVAWVDVDVVDYPESIIQDLQSLDVDVVVPNCFATLDDGTVFGYDKNNWQETEQSLELQKSLDPDFVLAEGYDELLTGRYYLTDMPRDIAPLEKVPLDGVGATFTLVKAHVHREGANFPVVPFEHQVETEGFAKVAKAMGFGVYGLPNYLIYHAFNG